MSFDLQASTLELIEARIHLPADLVGFLPLEGRCDPGDGRKRDLKTLFENWLDDKSASKVGILSGELGCGKTTAIYQLLRQLHRKRPMIWFPLGDLRTLDKDPLADIFGFLWPSSGHREDLCQRDAGVECIVLDGLDEALRRHSPQTVAGWLDALCRTLPPAGAPHRPRLLLAGRGYAFRDERSDAPLWNVLSDFEESCRAPTRFSLIGGNDAWLRDHLEQQLRKRFDKKRVDLLLSAVPAPRPPHPGALTSHLLFGLALEVLWEAGAEPHAMPSEWDVVSRWVELVTRRRGPHSDLSISAGERRRAAGLIALYLALTGRELEGAPLDELRNIPQYGLPPIDERLLAGNPRDLISGTLLRESTNGFRIFHEVPQNHLAAEALRRLARGAPDLGEGGGPGGPSGPSDPDWNWPLHQVNVAGLLERVGAVIRSLPPRESAWRPNSSLAQALTCLLLAPYRGDPATLLESYRDNSKLDKAPEAERHFLLLWKDVVKRHWETKQSLIEPDRAYTSTFNQLSREAAGETLSVHRASPESAGETLLPHFDHSGGSGIRGRSRLPFLKLLQEVGLGAAPIPHGRLLVWEPTKDFRKSTYLDVPAGVWLGVRPVTVTEYTEFLRSSELLALPQTRGGRWKREGRSVTHVLDGDTPVTGVSRAEAEAYVSWLASNWYEQTGDAETTWRLPDAAWLQVAALGTTLDDPLPSGRGPFGHMELLGRIWHWTSSQRGTQALLFGSSEPLGHERGEDLATYVATYLIDFCRELPPATWSDRIGFRVCAVVPRHAVVLHEQDGADDPD